jgi:hypothetical protein
MRKLRYFLRVVDRLDEERGPFLIGKISRRSVLGADELSNNRGVRFGVIPLQTDDV